MGINIPSPQRLRLGILFLAIFATIGFGQVRAGKSEPISGAKFDSLVAAQDLPLQRLLETLLPDRREYFIAGPLDPFYSGNKSWSRLFTSVRVICPDLTSLERATDTLARDPRLGVTATDIRIHQGDLDDPAGYRGVLLTASINGNAIMVQVLTVQQLRWLIWVEPILERDNSTIPKEKLDNFTGAVSDNLYSFDRGWNDILGPTASAYGLRDILDIYQKPPEPVFPGKDAFNSFLEGHAAIHADFANGAVAFIPGDSLLEMLKQNAPKIAYPNRLSMLLQYEYLQYFARGGDPRAFMTLTRPIFDSLEAGTYVFAVGIDGSIRIARVPTQAEIARAELETGKQAPVPYDAFLFPGEPVLTAGKFAVKRDSTAHITEVAPSSEHYFYSNFDKSVVEDITANSDTYLLGVGHFLTALDKFNIDCDSIIIRKIWVTPPKSGDKQLAR